MSKKSIILIIATILLTLAFICLGFVIYYNLRYKVILDGQNIALFKDNEKFYEEKHLNGIISYEIKGIGTKISASSSIPLQDLYDEVRSRVNFYVYFPYFIPDGFEIRKEISIGPSKENTTTVNYSVFTIGDTSLGTGVVWILQENLNGQPPDYLINKWQPFLNGDDIIKKDVIIKGATNVMMGQEINNGQTFTTLIFEKDTAAIVFLHSTLPLELLIRIADSMN